MRTALPLLVLAACSTTDGAGGDKPADTQVEDGWVSPDVSEVLGEGEVRAGIVADGNALFGGVSAEGREGDFKIYNDRVQFIIQSDRDGDYYETYGGGVIDADIVRPEGQPGRDMVDELWVMVGLGRIVDPTSVEVISDGTDGNAAVVRVTGKGAPMTLLTGAVETPAIVEDLDVDIVTDYTLQPGAWLLEATTTVTWNDVESSVQIGDVSMVGMEVADAVFSGRGLETGDVLETGDWVSVVGRNNEAAFALLSGDAPFASGAIARLLAEVGPVIAGFAPAQTLNTGDTATVTRSIGVGPDLATITAAWREAQGVATTTVGGTVTADGNPVPGARVHLHSGTNLETIAVTGEDGVWSASVAGDGHTATATGRGHGNILDLPTGAGWVAPYAHEVPAATALTSLEVGALAAPFAEGYGISAPATAASDTALTLTAPGALHIGVADGGPAVVIVSFASGDPSTGGAGLVPGRPSGAVAYGYVRDGDLEMPIEPGDYNVTVHRGLRWEPHTEAVSITSGGSADVNADLVLVVRPEGVLALDPHSHASPSGDGQIAMSHRLITHAANGVQVHFGTDHDHVADYRPMLAPLGLQSWMTTIVADEVSPVLRGHMNVYPIEAVAGQPNGGAPRWWDGIETTDLFYQQIRTRVGPDAIMQVNHPDGSSGMFGLADYNPTNGTVGSPDKFSEGFDAMEVLNDGQYDDFFPFYVDLNRRGYGVIAIGVSDSHGYRNGVGENLTWLDVGLDDPADLTNAALTDAMRERRTVVSRGPYLDVRSGGAWAPGQLLTGSVTLTVDVLSASFVQVDTVDLMRDGEIIESVAWEGDPLSFELPEDGDSSYIVIAHGATSMAPVYTQTPWAMAAAIQHDVDGDGWTAPFPRLEMD